MTALAFAASVSAALVAYASARVLSAWLWPEPPPALVLGRGGIAYFNRALVAVYAGGLAFIPTWVLAQRAPRALVRGLPVLLLVGAGALLLQAIFVP